MSTSTVGLFLRHLALSEEVGRLGTTSDHDLLAAYESERGQAAFTELMRRHGPMVLRTCRRLLGRGPDAEDAFQATFILLARQAGQVCREAAGRQSLGGWLHRVAYRTAVSILRRATRRRTHEGQADVMSHADPDPVAEATWNEVRPILDAELDAMPEQARRLLIACYLQEKTHAEAAAELGLPQGSIAWHLQRARTLLAERLTRRGITVSAFLLAVLLDESAKGAAVPAVLLVHTVEAARTFPERAAGVLSENVARLVKGGLAQMTKGWTHLSMALAGWVGLLGAGLIACQALKVWPDQKPQSAPAAERLAQEGDKLAHTDHHGDPLPEGALARMGTTRLRHSNQVNSVLFAPDGKTVASGGLDGTLRLWDAASGKLVRTLKHPPQVIMPRPVSFDRDGKTLVSAAGNQFRLHWLWDVKTGELLRERNLKLDQNQHISLYALSSDGKTVASISADGVIQLWDVASEKQLRVLQGPSKSAHVFSFSPDNKTLAVAGEDKPARKHFVWLWDVSSGKLLHKLEQPLLVMTVVFSPDGKTLASAGMDKPIQPGTPERTSPSAVRLWDAATGKLLRTLEGHQHEIHALSFSPNNKIVASGSDKTIRLWDVTTGKELRQLKSHEDKRLMVRSLSFAPDGKVLASSGTGPTVNLWDVTTGEDLHRAGEAHKRQVQSVSFSPDGRTLATAASYGTVRLWEAASGKLLRVLEHLEGAHSVAFAPDGKLLASGGAGVVCLWDAATGKALHKLESPGGAPLALSPDGKLLAVGSVNGNARGQSGTTVCLWDVASGTQLRTLEHPNPILSVAFSPDGKTLAVGTAGSGLYLWNAVTGKKEFWDLEKFDACALSFAPDGKTLAVGSYDRKIHLFEAPTGKERHTLTGHESQVLSVAFSPSGRLLASAGADQTVRLWEVNAGLASECHPFRGHDAQVTAIAFSSDGRRLASGSWDSTALVWDVTGLAGGQARAPRLTQGERTACWQSLIGTDAARAYQVMLGLAAAPDQAVPFLAERLQEQIRKRLDSQQVAHLLAELDNEDFRVRSKAAKEIEKWGEAAEPALRQALQGNPSLEVRRRIRQLLEAMHPDGVSLVSLRWLRVVEVLEWIDTPAARELLGKVAASAPREEVRREAKAALRRLHALPNP